MSDDQPVNVGQPVPRHGAAVNAKNMGFACSVCRNVGPPDGLRPFPEDTSGVEATLMSSCEACGCWCHNLCFAEPMRKHLLHSFLLKQQRAPGPQEGAPAEGEVGHEGQLAAAGSSLVQIHCSKCTRAWSLDCFSLGDADEACARRLTNEVQRVWQHSRAVLARSKGFANSGTRMGVDASLSRCMVDVKAIAVQPRTIAFLGPSGAGKSLLLDVSGCSLWPDNPYTALPPGWTPAWKAMLSRSFRQLPEAVVLEAQTGGGIPAFGPAGGLQGLKGELDQDEAATQHLAEYYMLKVNPLASQVPPGVLPTSRQDQLNSATTGASIMLLRDARHGVLLFTCTAAMLLKVVLALRDKERDEGLDDDEMEMLKAVFGVEGGLAGLQAKLGTDNLDTVTAMQLQQAVSAAVLAVLGSLGRPVTYQLPGSNPQHERVFLRHLLSRICRQVDLDSYQPWMWLVWLVVRTVPSGLLPEKDALVDMAGVDSRPIHQVFRDSTLPLAHAVVLMANKDFSSYKPSPLKELEDAGLLKQVSNGQLSLMLVLSDHTSLACNDYLNPAIWEPIQAKWKGCEERCLTALETRLEKISPGRGKQLASKVSVVTTRARAFQGLMAAWSSGRLADKDDEQMNTLLRRTGALYFYHGLMSILKEDTCKQVSTIVSRTSKLTEMVHVLLGQPHSAVDKARPNRPGGLGPLAKEQNDQYVKALNQLKDKVSSRLVPYTDGLDASTCLRAVEELWAVGRSEAERRVRAAKRDSINTSLPSIDELEAGLDLLQSSSSSSNSPSRRTCRAASLLEPLLDWIQDIDLTTVQQLHKPLQSALSERLQEAAADLPAFQALPALSRLMLLWLDYLLPLVMDSMVNAPDKEQKMLEDVHTELRTTMMRQIKTQLVELRKQLVELRKRKQVPDASYVELFESDVIKGSWEAINAPCKDNLLAIVKDVLVSHLVHKPVEALESKNSSGAALYTTMLKRMRGDLDLLLDPENLEKVKGLMDDLHVPTSEMQQTLNQQIGRGAQNLERVIVLMHRHKHLLTKYVEHNIQHFDTVVDRKLFNDFRILRQNGIVFDMPRTTKTMPSIDERLLHLDVLGVEVDKEHVVSQLCNNAFGVLGKVKMADGSMQALSLADAAQQRAAVLDMLQCRLIQAAVEELHCAPGSDWFSNATGVSAPEAVMTGSGLTRPMQLLALLALWLRCHLRVRIPLQAQAAPREAGASAKRRRTGAHGSGGSSGSSTSRQLSYVFVIPPTTAAAMEPAPAAAMGGMASASTSSRSSKREVAPYVQRGMLLQLLLREEAGTWKLDVVSSTRMASARAAAELGKEDDEYERCVDCLEATPGETLQLCDGRDCAVAVHPRHLPKNERKKCTSTPWLCPACIQRGRSAGDRTSLKPGTK